MGRRILVYGGACIAFSMGSGFASGQEINQFFSSFGLWGSIGAAAIAAFLYIGTASRIMIDAQQKKFSGDSKVYLFYCGNRIGVLLEWGMPVLMLLFLTVMFSGAGAVLEEAYGVPSLIGRLGMAGITFFTVLLGLSGLVATISPIGIAIALIATCLSIVSLIPHWQAFLAPELLIHQQPERQLYFLTSWWQSGLLYGAFNIVTAFPFFASIGRKAATKKEAVLISVFGGLSFIGAGMAMNLAFLANLSQIQNKQVPFLWIVESTVPQIGELYPLIVLAGIYTTAVPLLWSICRNKQREKSQIGRWKALSVAGLACIGGYFPFSDLVGSIYPIAGYLGVVLLFFLGRNFCFQGINSR